MHAPTDIRELTEIVIEAAATGERLEIRGGGGKAAFGCDREDASVLDMRGFASIIDYDPAELTLLAGAGAPLAEIQKLVAAQGQMLAFEPWDQAALFGGSAGAGGVPLGLSAGGLRHWRAGFVAQCSVP